MRVDKAKITLVRIPPGQPEFSFDMSIGARIDAVILMPGIGPTMLIVEPDTNEKERRSFALLPIGVMLNADLVPRLKYVGAFVAQVEPPPAPPHAFALYEVTSPGVVVPQYADFHNFGIN